MIYDGQVLQIVVFSILFGIALLLLGKGHHRQTMLNFAEGLAEVMFKFTGLIMYLAPFAVGSAIAYTVGHMGIGVLVNLIKLVATLYVALIAFMLLVLLPVALIFRINVVRFLKAIAEPVSLAFATIQFGSGTAQSDGRNGKFRRTAQSYRLCNADGI